MIVKEYVTHYRVPAFLEKTQGKGFPEVVYHYRKSKTDWVPSVRGGMSIYTIILDDNTIIEAMSLCSMKDSFSYKTGLRIAKGRAYKKLDNLKN